MKATRHRLALGIDPGASTGLALVRDVPGGLPELLGAWCAWGADREWLRRLNESLGVVGVLAFDRGVALADVVVWVEEPPSHWRSGGPRNTQAAARGIGRRMGQVEMAWAQRTEGTWPRRVQGPEWWEPWRGQVAHGKIGDGGHRIAEAGRWVEGARAVLAAMEQETTAARERRVDVAEAILIAGAAAMAGPERARRAG